jgi:hypothetical protein
MNKKEIINFNLETGIMEGRRLERERILKIIDNKVIYRDFLSKHDIGILYWIVNYIKQRIKEKEK